MPLPKDGITISWNNPLNYMKPITINLYIKPSNPGVG